MIANSYIHILFYVANYGAPNVKYKKIVTLNDSFEICRMDRYFKQ